MAFITCPKCDEVNPDRDLYCYRCGANLGTVHQPRAISAASAKRAPHTLRCPDCGYRNSPNRSLCQSCGRPLSPITQPTETQLFKDEANGPAKQHISNTIPDIPPISSQESMTTVARRTTKKCPYCAEEILIEAKVCRFCGRSLIGGPPEIVTRKRVELTQRLADCEKELAELERQLQEYEEMAQLASHGYSVGCTGLIVSIVLIPLVIGVLIAPFALIGMLVNQSRIAKATERKSQIRPKIEEVRAEMADLRAKLSVLQ